MIRTELAIVALLLGFGFISSISLGFATTNLSGSLGQGIQSQSVGQSDLTDNENTGTASSTNVQPEPQDEIPKAQEQTQQVQSIDEKLSELSTSDKDTISQEVDEAIGNVLDNPPENPQDMKIQICVHREKLPDGSKGDCDLWLTIDLTLSKTK